ncbi:MAG: fumarylpyruvate hydrolase [Paracoccaceae bacterium]|jgi:fumarylpyruvate hydrolase
MTNDLPLYAIEPPVRPSLPIVGTAVVFPVNRVFCIGRNYAAHAVEMGHDPDKEAPFFFLKSATCLTSDGVFPYPSMSNDVHFEVEMTVALARGGSNIDAGTALDHVFGYGVGLDMTRRDLQAAAKKAGRPWEVGKSFERSGPCGPLTPVSEIGHPNSGAITLDVNGQQRQSGDLNQMIWKTPEIIAVLSQYFELQAGDVIMTGTPSGVGQIQRGDTMLASIKGVGRIEVDVI